MTDASSATRRSTSSFGRILLSTACLSLAAASVAHYESDSRLRAAAARFGREFSIDLRWPYVKSMQLEPAGDLASDVVVRAALQDARAAIPAEESGPGLHNAWVPPSPIGRREEELRAARDLMVDAITARPGWPYHRLLLGQVVNAAARRRGNGEPVPPLELWVDPLAQAAAAAPGLDAVWAALGEAYLEAWPELSPVMRADAPRVLKRAFLDPSFVSRGFLAAVAVLGRDQTMTLLPEDADLLEEAARALWKKGDLQGSSLLMARMEKAERSERAADLLKIEERNRLGDVNGLRAACLAWASRHPAGDFDDPVGREQAARVLELWPSDRTASWRTSVRAEFVRFFLNGRESDVKGEALARSLDCLSGVPEAVRARGKLLAGDIDGAEALAVGSEQTDPLEWSPYLVELAKLDLKRGMVREAKTALERVAPGAREGCDVLLAHRQVARGLGDSAELEALDQTLDSVRVLAHSAEADPGSAELSLSFCLDPEWGKGRILTVEVEVAGPAVLGYGWDGGRSGTLSVSEKSSILRVPLTALSGRRNFSVRALIGGPVRELRAAVIETAG